jgi:hypothetical protein
MSFDENPQLNSKIDFKKYKENIPKCCKLQNYEEHRDILMFCWGLISLIEHNAPDKAIGCETCEFYKNP